MPGSVCYVHDDWYEMDVIDVFEWVEHRGGSIGQAGWYKRWRL